MKDLDSMPNIGETLAQKLTAAGINTPQDLIETGSKNAFIKIKIIDDTACCNMLYALEGAIRGIRWHSLDGETKQVLKRFAESMK